MARSRNIKPSFFKNEGLGELPIGARLAFIGLWTLADREGRLEDRPARIAAELFPYDRQISSEDVDGWLTGLSISPEAFIVRYSAGNRRFIQIANFKKHQSPHIKEQESTIPAPDLSDACIGLAPDMPGADTVQAQEEHGTGTDLGSVLHPLNPSSLNPSSLNPEENLSFIAGKKQARKKPVQEGDPVADWFNEEFWPLYPRKDAKADALKAARAKGKTEAIRTEIIDGLQAHLPNLSTRDKSYIKLAGSWLRGERWRDEIAEPATPGQKRDFNAEWAAMENR